MSHKGKGNKETYINISLPKKRNQSRDQSTIQRNVRDSNGVDVVKERKKWEEKVFLLKHIASRYMETKKKLRRESPRGNRDR